MRIVQEDELMESIEKWIRRTRDAAHSGPMEMTEETDLIASGILDSLGFIELMLYLETLTEEKIDLNDADPKDFTTMRGLCRTILCKNAESQVGRL
jgi:acyl carrier protein